MSPSMASTAAPAGPTPPANPNPRAAPVQENMAPLPSTNRNAQQPGATPAAVNTKKRSHGTLREQMGESRMRRRLNGEEEKVRTVRVPVSQASKVGSAAAKPATINTEVPAKAAMQSSTDRMVKKTTKHEHMTSAARQEKTVAIMQGQTAPAPPVKQKRKVAWDDDSDEEEPEHKKPCHKPVSTASARPVETPLSSLSARERRKVEREQRSILHAIQSPSRAPDSAQPAAEGEKTVGYQGRADRADNQHAVPKPTKAAYKGTACEGVQPATSKKPVTNGYGKPAAALTASNKQLTASVPKHVVADTVAQKQSVDRAKQVQSTKSSGQDKYAPQRRTVAKPGKSTAISSVSVPGSDFDSDLELPVEKKLTPTEQKRQAREHRRKLLAARKLKQDQRQASRSAGFASQTPTISDSSRPSSSSSHSAGSKPLPLIQCSTHSSEESSKSPRERLVDTSRASIGRKFFKD